MVETKKMTNPSQPKSARELSRLLMTDLEALSGTVIDKHWECIESTLIAYGNQKLEEAAQVVAHLENMCDMPASEAIRALKE